MTDRNDKLELEVGPNSVKLASEGDAARRLTEALADLASPLTEIAGAIGDSIRLFRIRSTIRALDRANAIAHERGVKLRPVPPKFLVQWLENSSLEDESDEDLTELWAKVLVSASSQEKNAKISYLDLLRKIGKDEATLLYELASDMDPRFSRNFHKFYAHDDFCERVAEIGQKEGLTIADRGFVKNAEGMALQFNYRLLYVDTPDTLVIPTDFYISREKSVAILEREGAVNIRTERSLIISYDFTLSWLQLTKFGFDFVWACEGQ